MKRLLLLAACLLMAADAEAQRWGEYRYAHETVRIRAERTTNSDIVGTLSRGDRALVAQCQDNPGTGSGVNDGVWCAVYWTYQDAGDPGEMTPRGYAYEPLLKASRPAVRAPRRSVACCKICRKGKACGNSCISRRYTCRKPPGCACNG